MAKRRMVTSSMSLATLFSRRSTADRCWEATESWTSLFCRRIARNILMWLITGITTKSTPHINKRPNAKRGRKKWKRLAQTIQLVAVHTASLTAPVNKRKTGKRFSIIIHQQIRVQGLGYLWTSTKASALTAPCYNSYMQASSIK